MKELPVHNQLLDAKKSYPKEALQRRHAVTNKSMSLDRIGIISPSTDYHAAAVVWGLKKCNINSAWISPTEQSTKSISIGITCEQTSILLRQKDGAYLEMMSLKGLWFRRTAAIPEIQSGMHPDDIELARKDWEVHYRSLMLMIASSGAYCLNHPFAKYFEDKKPYQLQIAKNVGLSTPLTYIGNDVGEMRKLFRNHKKVAYKTLTPNTWKSNDLGENFRAAYTQLLDRDAEIWDQFHLSPAIVQEYVPKSYEVRITVIGKALIAIGIDSQRHESSKIDWRDKSVYAQKDVFFQIRDIPEDVHASILKYCAIIGIDFCAFDFIVTPKNEWVFLEGNNSGQFLFCEVMVPDVHILDIFCKHLASSSGLTPCHAQVTMREFEHSAEGIEALKKYKTAIRGKNR